MGKPSRYSDADWERAFAREQAGEARQALADELGVSISTMNWQARKRGLKRGVTPGWVDRRRRPAGGWPPDQVFAQSRSGMTTRRWRDLLERYVAGEPVEALAGEYGVSEGRIADVAREEGMRKQDRAEAVYRPRGPGAAVAGTGAYLTGSAGRAALAFAFDADDPQASAAELAALETAAARDGRAADFLTLRRMRRAAGLKAAGLKKAGAGRDGPRPETAVTFDPEDETATCASILNAMLWAMEEERYGDFRDLERLLKQVERNFTQERLYGRGKGAG